jgi:hypothetical protein
MTAIPKTIPTPNKQNFDKRLFFSQIANDAPSKHIPPKAVSPNSRHTLLADGGIAGNVVKPKRAHIERNGMEPTIRNPIPAPKQTGAARNFK